MADEPQEGVYATPNRMVWVLFGCARDQVLRARDAEASSDEKNEALQALFLAVAAAETFVNAYFRVLVSGEGFAEHEGLVLQDLHREPRAGLRHKLNHWPPKILGKSIPWQKEGPARFDELRELRNRLMHFTSSHETAEAEGVRFHGMADVSDFETLTAQVAFDAVTSAEDVVAEIFRLRGLTEEDILHGLHSWTGRVPVELYGEEDPPDG